MHAKLSFAACGVSSNTRPCCVYTRARTCAALAHVHVLHRLWTLHAHMTALTPECKRLQVMFAHGAGACDLCHLMRFCMGHELMSWFAQPACAAANWLLTGSS
jgi:hypothetical protein